MPIPKFSYSFEKGFLKMTLEDARKARKELYSFLGCNNESNYCRKKKGYKNIPAHIYKGVTEIFAKYGVSESDVWTRTELAL